MQVREFDFRSLDKILPCPFCGGDAELDTGQTYRALNGQFGHRVVVYCTKCDADMGTCVEDVPDIHPNEVIERWNCRAAPQGDGLAELRALSEKATPGVWSTGDWRDDFGDDKVTIEASRPEILSPGQSSIWPGGLVKVRVASTDECDNPLEDAAFIVACVNHVRAEIERAGGDHDA